MDELISYLETVNETAEILESRIGAYITSKDLGLLNGHFYVKLLEKPVPCGSDEIIAEYKMVDLIINEEVWSD